jgi:AcrR family transcriptional regulator
VHPIPTPAPRRRERLRDQTVAEIKQLAWSQIAEAGAVSLSLRAVARDMGMTSSALYRYFSSRDELLRALARDGFASLADRLEAAEAQVARRSGGTGDHFKIVFRAYRAWSLEHPTEYALMFGTPVPGLEEYGPEVKEEMFRGIAVLLRIMVAGLQAGDRHLPALAPGVERRLRAKLRRWTDHGEVRLPPEALAACLFAWTQLHGVIQLEVFHHLPSVLLPADDLFEQFLHMVHAALGGTD